MSQRIDETDEDGPCTVQDAVGDTLSFMKIGNRMLTADADKANWDGVKSVQGRDDDVLIVTSAKSGSHLMYEIVSMIQRGSSEPIPNIMEEHHLDFLPFSTIKDIQSPRTMCTHRYSDELPQDMISKRCKMIHVVRNPKDSSVSYFHHLSKLKSASYGGKFTNFIPVFLKGEVPFNGWDDHFLKWTEFKKCNPDYPILTLRYEDLLANPVNEIKKVASLLQKEYSDKLYEEIAANTQFDKMKTHKESLHNPFLPFFKDEKEIMYRKGKTSDWKNYFSSSEATDFDKYYRDKLEEADYVYLNDS